MPGQTIGSNQEPTLPTETESVDGSSLEADLALLTDDQKENYERLRASGMPGAEDMAADFAGAIARNRQGMRDVEAEMAETARQAEAQRPAIEEHIRRELTAKQDQPRRGLFRRH